MEAKFTQAYATEIWDQIFTHQNYLEIVQITQDELKNVFLKTKEYQSIKESKLVTYYGYQIAESIFSGNETYAIIGGIANETRFSLLLINQSKKRILIKIDEDKYTKFITKSLDRYQLRSFFTEERKPDEDLH